MLSCLHDWAMKDNPRGRPDAYASGRRNLQWSGRAACSSLQAYAEPVHPIVDSRTGFAERPLQVGHVVFLAVVMGH